MSNVAEIAVADPRDLVTAFTACWNRHDMASLARLFVEDAQMVNVVGIWWRDRASIEAAHAALHAGPFRDSRLVMEAPALRVLGDGLVVLHVPWRLSGQLRPDGTPDGVRRGIMLFVAGEGAAGWRILVAQNTDIAPGVVVPAAAS